MKRTLAAVFSFAFLPGIVGAQAVQNIVLRNSFTPFGAGARGVGMGGAFIAVADDGTAATFNPAGLAQLRRSELAFVAFLSQITSTSTPLPSTARETQTFSSTHAAPDFLGLAVPFYVGEHRLTVQVSYQRAVDLVGQGRAMVPVPSEFLDIDLEDGQTVIADVTPEQTGAFNTISGAAAYQLTSRFSLGASLNYWLGGWSAAGTRTLLVISQSAPGQAPKELELEETEFVQDQSMRGWNLNAGFLLDYGRVSVGGVVRLPFNARYDLEETIDTVDLEDIAIERNTEFSITSQLHWPRSAGIGVAIRPVSGLTLSMDFSSTLWSRTFIEELPDGALLTPEQEGIGVTTNFTDRSFFDLFPKTVTTTKDASQWHIGVEYLLLLPKVILPLRTGYFRDRSPVSEPHTDEGRKIEGFTIGTGLNFNRFVFDVAYERRDSEGSLGLRRFGSRSSVTNPTESVTQNR